MQIQGYSNTQAVNPFELDPQSRRRTTPQQANSSGDTVEFSDEALELLAQMQAAKQQAIQDEATKLDASAEKSSETKGRGLASASSSQPAGDAGSATPVEAGAEGKGGNGGGGGGGSSSDNTAGEAEQLRKQIQQLSATVQNIMKSSLPSETKMTQSQPFEAQISALEQQLREVEAQAAQQKK